MSAIKVFLVIVALCVDHTVSKCYKGTPQFFVTLRRVDGRAEAGTVTIEMVDATHLQIYGILTNLKSGSYVGVLYPKSNVRSKCKRTGIPMTIGKDVWTIFEADADTCTSRSWSDVPLKGTIWRRILTSNLIIYSMPSGGLKSFTVLLNATNTMEAVACGEIRVMSTITTRKPIIHEETTTTPLKTTTTPRKTTTTTRKKTTTTLKTTTSPRKTTTTTPLDDPKSSPTVPDNHDDLSEQAINRWHTLSIISVVSIAVLLFCCCWNRR